VIIKRVEGDKPKGLWSICASMVTNVDLSLLCLWVILLKM